MQENNSVDNVLIAVSKQPSTAISDLISRQHGIISHVKETYGQLSNYNQGLQKRISDQRKRLDAEKKLSQDMVNAFTNLNSIELQTVALKLEEELRAVAQQPLVGEATGFALKTDASLLKCEAAKLRNEFADTFGRFMAEFAGHRRTLANVCQTNAITHKEKGSDPAILHLSETTAMEIAVRQGKEYHRPALVPLYPPIIMVAAILFFVIWTAY
jgi:hypothetical protein